MYTVSRRTDVDSRFVGNERQSPIANWARHEHMSIDPLSPGRTYSFRPGFFAREITYTIEPSAIGWQRGSAKGRIDFASVRSIRLRRSFMNNEHATGRKTIWLGSLVCNSGRSFPIGPLHRASFRSREDRSQQFNEFLLPLLAVLRKSNPQLDVSFEQGWAVKLNRLIASAGSSALVYLVRIIRLSNREDLAEVSSFVARKLGPFLRAHRVARANLMASFPEKSVAEIDTILDGVWDNFGRVPVEFAFIDRLWDFTLETGDTDRIVIEPAVAERIRKLMNKGGPTLCFGAHLANWEIPALAAAGLGMKSAMIYRRPGSEKLAAELLKVREGVMGRMIPVGPRAGFNVVRALRQGYLVGTLTDQHAARGIQVEFFGRRCFVSPAIGLLARQFNCPVHGVRSIRLSKRRFAFELTEPLDPPRDADGKINVAGTMQMVTSIIEGWVREHPEQWLWLHRRWR